jgi:DNA-binding response OmpR family regulator
MLRMVLEKAGYRTQEAENGAQALEIARACAVDCVVMDVVMPVMDGLEACRTIRQFSQVPVLLLSARGEEDDLVEGFTAGAYDYMIKPFRPRELVARVGMHLKRAAESARPPADRDGSPANRLEFLDLILDARARQVFVAGEPVDMTVTGYSLLEYFMRHPAEVISKEVLLREVWADNSPVNGKNMVEAAIKRLRKELRDDSRNPRYIKTVWGLGYRLG